MPKHYWDGRLAIVVFSIVIGAVIIVIVWDEAVRLTENRLRSEQGSKAHIEYAEDRIDQECRRLEGTALRDCVHEQIKSANDHNRAEQDLNAQQVMARFTRVMGYVGIIGLFVGAGFIYLIFATLRATQGLLWSERAYISYEDVQVVRWFPKGQNPVIKGIGISVFGKNYGKSPAVHCDANAFFFLLDKGKIPDQLDREKFRRQDRVGTFTAPGKDIYAQVRLLDFGTIQQVISGEKDLLISFTCWYEDIFGRDQFCSQTLKVEFPMSVQIMKDAPEGFDLSLFADIHRSNYQNDHT